MKRSRAFFRSKALIGVLQHWDSRRFGSAMVAVSKLPLKEAHSGEGLACIAWDVTGQCLLTAGSDARLLIHDWGPSPSASPKVHHDHKDGITGLAFSPLGNYVTTASLDHAVKLYTYPGMKFQSNVTRFTLPIRSVAFSCTGGLLAAAGDDDGIKLISTVDSAIVRVLKGHDDPVLSVAFDPKNEYIASADSDGTVIFWAVSGKRMHTLDRAAPHVDANLTGRNEIAWHPQGSVLAVPGRRDDVVLYDRDTAGVVCTLKGGHSGSVIVLAWSPNGKYLATAGKDKKVLLWDVEKRQDLDSQKFDAQICGLAWRPSGNSLAVIDKNGRFGVWEAAIPSHMTSPTALVTSTPTADREALLKFGDDDSLEKDDDVAATSSSDGSEQLKDTEIDDGVSDFGKDSREKATLELKTRLKRKAKMDASEAAVSPESFAQPSGRPSLSYLEATKMQAPFQPGSTKQVTGKRRFLTYSMLGSITSFDNEGVSHIEVEFHDTSTGTRIPAMTDYFGFTMAALCNKGGVFANPRKGEKKPSTLMYRPFNSWANNSEWSVRFQLDEEVKAVAIGSGWAAAFTSLSMLRIFSETGMQIFLMSLAGSVVTMAGHEHLLAIVTHAASPLQSGDQVLNFVVYDVKERTRTIAGCLPLSPGATLTWIGFSETGYLSSSDSQGVLRVYNPEFGGCWIPLFSAVAERKSGAESYWVVGLNNTQLYCIICKLPETEPQVAPRPVLSVLSLSLPLVSSDLGADKLENEYLRGSLLLSQARAKADAASTSEQAEDLEDEVLAMQAELDKCILRLIAAACKGDKLVRALDLATMLTLHKSMEGALKLVNALRLPALAERLSLILEERLAAEKCEVFSGGPLDDSRTADVASRPPSQTSLQHQRSVGLKAALDLPPTPLAPSKKVSNSSLSSSSGPSTKPNTMPLRSDSPKQSTPTTTMASKDRVDVPTEVAGPVSTSPASTATNPFNKASNPFAKKDGASASSSGSIMDSIRKMQSSSTETSGKRKPAAPIPPNKPQKLAKSK